ncbi:MULTISPECIES: HEPN domain-containing protein [Burkholderia cepacia complex]|uniref:HEPN domain-containing protein n=1 Tax=Burkholderia cepacia complex TaxID=87882 RepID=UPI000F57BFEE|nr:MULTISPECIES: HEPN domain-containing protein [Burkholderia cepacia complex]
MSNSPLHVPPQEPELNRLLSAALEQIESTRYPNVEMSILDAIKSNDLDVWLSAVNHIHKLTKGIKEALVNDDRFVGDTVKTIHSGLGGATGFYPHFVDQLLIRRAVITGSADGAIRWLTKVLSSTHATGKLILALWGVPVEKPVQLTDRVSIVPFDDLPDSDQKKIVGEHTNGMRGIVASALDFVPPKSALVVSRTIAPIIYDAENTHTNVDSYIKDYDLLREIALVLTLIGPRASLPSLLWFTFDDADFELGSFRTTPLTEIVPTRPIDYPNLDPNEATEVVGAYLQLEPDVRRHINVALERINQAQRRGNVGDRAVELATAFETLVGDGDKNEMTHKVKVRTVRMLGGSIDERSMNAAIINKAYSIRSTLVHTGRVNPESTETINGKRLPVTDIIDRALVLCVKLTKCMIMEKEIPNWRIFDIS